MTVSTFIQKSNRGNLETLIIDNPLGRAEIALFGAHILSFAPHHDNRQRLWLSPHAFFNGKNSIRGGIPVCWPWFSDDHGQEKGTLPAHGYLRNQLWQLTETVQENDHTTLTLVPSTTEGQGFPYLSAVSLTVTVGRSLTVTLSTTNTDSKAFNFNAALHTYFQVDNISSTRLSGLKDKYLDKLMNWQATPSPVPYTFSGETDRIHVGKTKETSIEMSEAITLITHRGHDSIVVWNPWLNAASIADMDPFGYKHMLCVETAITQGLELKPGEEHALTQIIE